MVIFLLPLVFPFFRYAFWIFAGNYYRLYSLLVIFVVAYTAIRGLNQVLLRGLHIPAFVWGVSQVLAMVIYIQYANVWTAESEQLVVAVDPVEFWLVLGFLLGYVVLFIGLQKAALQKYLLPLLLLLTATEIGLLSGSALGKNRKIANKSVFKEKLGFNDNTLDVLDIIKTKDSTGFYRVTKRYFSGEAISNTLNDSKAQDFFGTQSYHSFNQLNYVRFLGAFHVIDPKVEGQTRWISGLEYRPILNAWASNSYILTKRGAEPTNGARL